MVPARAAIAIGFCVLALPVCAAGAGIPLPLQTESATTLPAGSGEAVLGFSWERDGRFPPFTREGSLRRQDLWSAPRLQLRIAAGRRVDIDASFQLLALEERRREGDHHSAFGAGDARLFTRVRLLGQRETRPALGLRFGVKLPNADAGDRLGTDETDFEAAALISRDVGSFSLHANLGLALLGNPGPTLGAPEAEGSGQDDLFTWGLALVTRSVTPDVPAGWRAAVGVEMTGQAGSRFDNDRVELRGGIRLRRAGWGIYLGAAAGLAGAAPDVGVLGGLTYRFELARMFARRPVAARSGASVPAGDTSSGTVSTISSP